MTTQRQTMKQSTITVTTEQQRISLTNMFTLHYTTASLKVMKLFSHPQTRNQSQVVQNDKLSREYVETKIFVGGNCTFFHFLEKKLKKICEKISKKNFFFTKICFSWLEKAYVQLLVLNFFSDFDLQKLIFGNFEEFGLFFEVFFFLDKKKIQNKKLYICFF